MSANNFILVTKKGKNYHAQEKDAETGDDLCFSAIGTLKDVIKASEIYQDEEPFGVEYGMRFDI